MNVSKKEVYESGHPIYSDVWNEDATVVVKLTETKQYNDKVLVKFQVGEETEKYKFEVLPDEYRRLKCVDGESVPLGIRWYLSDFGYYLEDSTDGPWGQYEYLIDTSGRFEARAAQTNNPLVNFFFRFLAFRFQLTVVDAVSETAVTDEQYTQEQLLEATEIPNKSQLQLAHAITELHKLPLSESTVIPERFDEMDLNTEIVDNNTTDTNDAKVDISFAYDGQKDTTAVIATLPYSVKYFKLNGEPGGQCSLEFTDRRELPGPFIEDYLREKANIEIMNTPRIDSSASNIEFLSQARALLNNIQATDGIRIPSDESTVEVTQIIINISELFLRIQRAVGVDRFLNTVDAVFEERTDGLSVEDLTDAPFSQFDTVLVLLGVANMRLDDAEKEQIEIEMERKGLDEVDTDSIGINDLTQYITEQMTAIDEDW